MTTQAKQIIFFAIAIVFGIVSVRAADGLNPEINKILTAHYESYHDLEYFSAIQSSIQIGDSPVEIYTIGNTSREQGSSPIDAQSLFDIGSITKSFTAVLMLKAKEDKKISLVHRKYIA